MNYKEFMTFMIFQEFNIQPEYILEEKEENNIATDYELLPWEVYENSINRGWDWNKLTKIKTKYSNNIFNYYLFRLYKDRISY